MIVIVAGTVGFATVQWLRTRLPRPAIDALLAAVGFAIGIGGLLRLHDVGPASWTLCPLGLAVLLPLHVRALFAGTGPLRT